MYGTSPQREFLDLLSFGLQLVTEKIVKIADLNIIMLNGVNDYFFA